ncbi:MAG: hypothetical protein ACJ71T_01590 [Actinomycetales bacterium]
MTATLPVPMPERVEPLQRLHTRLRVRPRSIWSFFRRPGWPLAVVFVPFPLWWALGMSEFICMFMAVPMALYLLRQRRVQVPRGFGFWLVFLCWVAVGFLVLQVSAVGAVPDNSPTRFITWTYRLVWYLTCTVAALYVLNTRKYVPLERISRIVSCLFLTIIAGGVLGLLAPHFQFPSALELVLPKGITSVQFIQKMIHPSAAQLQEVLGYESPRPSAPYTFTNTWGMNFTATLPFFLHAWFGKEAAWRRYLAVPILLIAAVTAIMSLNRGMWITLVVMALFVAIRSAMIGKPGPLAGVVLAGAAIVILVASTSLGNVVNNRLSNAGSEQGRQNLSTLSVTSVAKTSPIIGLGSTRNVQGNFNSITGGATAQCPRCSPPALGTQGQLWLVVFSNGLFGLAMYLAFFAISFFRHLHRRSPPVTLGLMVVVASTFTSPFYNSLGTGLMVVMIGIGLLAREEALDPKSRRLPTLGDYVVPVVRWVPLVIICAILGAYAGAYVDKVGGKSATGVVTIVVPEAPNFTLVPSTSGPMTVDTLAQMLASDEVLTAVQRASGRRPVPGDNSLGVRATANSRTLHISYTAKTAVQAKAGAEAAGNAFVDVRTRLLEADRAAQLAALDAQASVINASLDRLETLINTPLAGKKRPPPVWSTFSLRTQSTALTTELRVIQQQTAKVTAAAVQPGINTQPTDVFFGSDPRRVDIASGLAVGFLVGALGGVLLGRRGRRARRRRAAFEQTDLPVLATLHPRDLARTGEEGSTDELTGVIETAVAVHDFGSCVAADDSDTRAVEVAGWLEHLVAVRRGDPRICVIVASDSVRTAPINRARAAAQRRGLSVIGVILVAGSTKARWVADLRPKLGVGRVGAADERKPGATDRH